MQASLLRKPVAALCALSLLVLQPAAHAGDLNTEVTNMFNNLGAVGNYTAPGAFKGQTFNTFTGGNLYLRSPNKTYQLAAIQFPSAKGGCGGIDLFGGSFSHISAAEFRNMLRNITAALPGIAFQLALESVSPLLGGLTKWAKGLETWINNARVNSCETATALVSSAAEAMGYDSQRSCAKLAMQMGLEADIDAAMRRCASDSPGILASARSSADPNIRAQAPFVGNFTWKALKNIDTLDDAAREMVMSVVGALIFYPQDSNRDPDYIGPSITTVAQLLYGQSDAAGGNVNVQLLRCNNYADCDVGLAHNANAHEPLTKKVENVMRSISDSIRTRAAIPNNSVAVGFVNSTSIPVWRMLSIGNTIPGSGLSEMMIGNYREVIAADYAFTFLNQFANVALSALMKQHLLNDEAEAARDSCSARMSTSSWAGCSRSSPTCTRRSSPCRPSPPIWNASSATCAPTCRRTCSTCWATRTAAFNRRHGTVGDCCMWEIYAYHNTESLAGIFNAIAAIVASGTYLSAIAAVAFCGFVVATGGLHVPAREAGRLEVARVSSARSTACSSSPA
jgi:conjugative transfer pilus assembly protein TraH